MSGSKSQKTAAKVLLPEEVDEAIEEQLDYGDSKSGWIRETCEMRLNGEFDDSDDEDQ